MRATKSELELQLVKMKLSVEALDAPSDDPRRVNIEGSFAREAQRWKEAQSRASETSSWSQEVQTAAAADVGKLASEIKNYTEDHKLIRSNLSNLRSSLDSLRVAMKRGH